MSIAEWAVGLAVPAGLALVAKKLPDWVASEEDLLLSNILSVSDAADQELILAMVKWADKKIPGSNQGHLKYQAVANLVTARFPMIPADKLTEIIEATVDQVKAEAEKKVGTPPAQP